MLPAIVIPIYNAPAEVDACIASVLRHTPQGCRVILIDDASDDPAVESVLAKHHDQPGIELHRNGKNLGYTRTVNRGIELAGQSDVILLNSDTKVTPGWVRNLHRAVYSDARIATATPFSNNAGAFSAPLYGKNNPLPDWLSLDDYARLVTQSAERSYPDVPTGSGFCLYIRRECLDQVGSFDAEAFPRGYGEENDFCMRALKQGWRHVIDDATLIYHARGASFGDAKTELLRQGRAVVDERYPDYKQLIRVFEVGVGLNGARQRIATALTRSKARLHPESRPRAPTRASTARARAEKRLRRAMRMVFPKGVTAARELKRLKQVSGSTVPLQARRGSGKPRALFVIATETGGTPQTNRDLMGALDDRYECLLLKSNAKSLTLQRFAGGDFQTLRQVRLPVWLEPFPHVDPSYDRVVRGWLAEYAVDIVHIRHVVWHSLSLPRLARELDIPVVFSFHDFYSICPTVRLLDENDVFCAGACTSTPGQCTHVLWRTKDFPPLKRAAVFPWREQMTPMLAACDAFITTSDYTRDLIQRFFPITVRKPFEVIEHGRDFASFASLGAFPDPGSRVRVLVPGNISPSKGARILDRMQALNRDGRFEFHLMGDYVRELQRIPNLVLHGPYERASFAEIARSILPHFGAVLSIWPETFCHTLTEMWACGLPVVAYDMGAVGDRIRRYGGGWLVEDVSADAMFASLTSIVADPSAFEARLAEVDLWQQGPGREQSCAWMANSYDAVYRRLLSSSQSGGPENSRCVVAIADFCAHLRLEMPLASGAQSFLPLQALLHCGFRSAG